MLTLWMNLEIGKINEGLVRDRKSLSALLQEKMPCATTEKGAQYCFSREIIATPGKRLPEDLHLRLRLPVLFFVTADVPDSCWCMDKEASLVLPGEISSLRTMQDGKLPCIPGNCIRDPADIPDRRPDCHGTLKTFVKAGRILPGRHQSPLPDTNRNRARGALESVRGALQTEKTAGVPEGPIVAVTTFILPCGNRYWCT